MDNKTALLLIDIQNDYFPGGSMELAGALEALANARRLLDRHREQGLPVIHVQHLATRSDATFFLPGSEGAEIRRELAPEKGEHLIVKHFPNSFHQTDLLELLRRNEVTKLTVAGMMTHMCVDTTVRAAKDLGLDVVLYGDACATRALSYDGVTVPAEQVQIAYLAGLNGLFAEVRKTEER